MPPCCLGLAADGTTRIARPPKGVSLLLTPRTILNIQCSLGPVVGGFLLSLLG
jgi:hypothetical protein